MTETEKNIIRENINKRVEVKKQIRSLNNKFIEISKENIELTEKTIELLEKYLIENKKSSFKKILELLFNNNYSNSFYDRLFNLDPTEKKSKMDKLKKWFNKFSVDALKQISIDLEKYLV